MPDQIKYLVKVQTYNQYKNLSLTNGYPLTSDFYNVTAGEGTTTSNNPLWYYEKPSALTNLETNARAHTANLHTKSKTLISWNDAASTAKFLNLDNKILKAGDKVYTIHLERQSSTTTATIAKNSTLDLELQTVFSKSGFTYRNGDAAQLLVIGETYKIVLYEGSRSVFTYNINADAERFECVDAPYNIFAIPYSDTFKFNNGTTTITCSKLAAMSVAADIATKPNNVVYDIQLLPYCPFEIDDTTYISTQPHQYSYIIGANETKVGVIFNVTSSTRNFTIAAPKTPYLQPTNLKLASCTTFARLVSPNYNGEFQFTPARNQGVSYFTVDLTLKPFQPYIHVAPAWGGLYGTNYGDARGLICGGDFSLPRTSDAWQNYQLNNKNYQEIFNRQIENMETNYNVAREQEFWNVLAGTGTGMAAGAGAGFMIGGFPGAAVGASTGLLSGYAGLRDRELNEQLRGEALDYTHDQFRFNLGNIKARPNTLTKVGALNANNKLWPIVEIWTCTEAEQKAVAAKIALNGMNVGIVDTLGTWIGNNWTATVGTTTYNTQNYIKAKLVRVEGINDESHYMRALANELNQGVYWIANGVLLPLMEEN